MSVYTIQNLHANIAAIPARVQSDLKSDYRYLQRMTMVIKTTRIEVCIINPCYFVALERFVVLCNQIYIHIVLF